MKSRNGWVSNSSSSSFLVCLRKGHSLDELVESAGAFKEFARDAIKFIGREVQEWQSIDNIELYQALKDGWIEHDAVKAVKDGEYSYLKERCLSTVDNPGEWFFGVGTCCNDSGDAIDNMIYDGYLNIKTDYFVLENR